MNLTNILLSENLLSQITVGSMGGIYVRCFLSAQIINFFKTFFLSVHFFKGLGIEDFLKSFHEFRVFHPI